jgi:predicted DNA-binding transcriptional regulator AlpA
LGLENVENQHKSTTHRAAALSIDKHDPALHSAPAAVRLLSKAEVLAIIGVTFPTLWLWMRQGKFPRSRIAGGKSVWRSDEVAAWLAELPVGHLRATAQAPGLSGECPAPKARRPRAQMALATFGVLIIARRH